MRTFPVFAIGEKRTSALGGEKRHRMWKGWDDPGVKSATKIKRGRTLCRRRRGVEKKD